MDLSPRSTVSSDLYPPSESSKPEDPHHPKKKGEFANEGLQRSSEVAYGDTEGSGYSNTMQGFDSPDDPVSRPSSTYTASGANGITDSSNKRKRDQDWELEAITKDYMEGVPLHNRNESESSMAQTTVPHSQARLFTDDQSRAKRLKTKGQALDTDIGAQLFPKSTALPAVFWQHILCYVPPVFLGRLLRVNHAFNTYLTPGSAFEDARVLPNSIIQPLKAEEIWIASRKRFAPGLPRPLHGLQELDMWRLLRGQKCQVCGQTKQGIPAPSLENPLEPGPGSTGVRIIWPFGVRCCGSCLQDVSKTEMDLLLSTDCPFGLLQALPSAFVSEASHYIAHSFMRSTTAPPQISLTKRYYKPHVEEIKRQFGAVKELGSASAEEWFKGLPLQGQERLEDLIRWEQWESRGGLKRVNSRPPLKAPGHVGSRIVKAESFSDRSTPQSMAFPARLDGGNGSPAQASAIDPTHIASTASTPPLQQPWNTVAPNSAGAQRESQNSLHQPRLERNIRDINEAKAARRAEIERRCAELDPPLLPNVLNHMESFQAAMQITQPLTEQSWDVLKPRILAQRPYAERREKEHVQQTQLLAEDYRQRRDQEAQLKETKDSLDREWETFQTPVRNRIGALADEIITTRWPRAKSITKDTSPKFAADVLVNVRQRFYAEVAQEDEAAIAAGKPAKTDAPDGPPTRKLILENMKWVFDTKIKPLTDHFQRELFLCNGCDGNFKFYGFEGVIQHYAAKHTTTLSMGNIVVHWRAEWPENPPFNPNPSVAKAAYYKIPTPAPIHAQVVRERYGQTNPSIYNQAVETGIHVPPQRGDNGHYTPNGHSASYAGPYPEGPSQGFPSYSYAAPHSAYNTGAGYSGYSGPPNGYMGSATTYNAYTNTLQAYGTPTPVQPQHPAFTQGQSNANAQAYIPGPNVSSYAGGGYPPKLSNGYPPSHGSNVPGPVSDLYQRQMDEMAKHAKDVFTSIGGVKDLPGSVRIYVVIQHMVSRFKATFPNEPSLTMFIDGLDHNAVMRPVRSVNGLGCRTCIRIGTSARLFTLPHLVNHFRTMHVETLQSLGYPQSPELDWKHDMIDLPELSVISNLVNAPGMADSKLSLIAWAFPDAFPPPLPNLRGRMNTGPLPLLRKEIDSNLRGPPAIVAGSMTGLPAHIEGERNDQPYFRPDSGYPPLSEGPSSESLEPPGEDEYDPHRPALLTKIVKGEPGSAQQQKPARLSTLRHGHRSSSVTRRGSPLYMNDTNDELSHDNASSARTMHNKDYPDRPFEPTEQLRQCYSARSNLISRSGHRLGVRTHEQDMPPRHENHQGQDASADYINRCHRSTGNRATGEKWRSSRHDLRSASPAEAMDHRATGENWRSSRQDLRSASPAEAMDPARRFLSNISSKQGTNAIYETYTSGHNVERHSKDPWPDELPSERCQKYIRGDSAFDQGSDDGTNAKIQGNDTPMDRISSIPLEPHKGDETIVRQRPLSLSQYYDDYRPSSHIQIPIKSVRAAESPKMRFGSYESIQPVIMHERQELDNNTMERPRSGTHSQKISRMPQYRGEQGSLPNGPGGMPLYRPRSPVEEDRGDGIYHTRSPPIRRQIRPQKIVSYDYEPQNRYEYIEDDALPENCYQHRVKYIRYEDPVPRQPTRYIVTRPVEQVGPEYIRYEPAYGDEPVYERNGQLYQAPQRSSRQ